MSSYKYLFTVIVPAYNRAEEISELLISLALQTIPRSDFEIIIVDDGSTDNTESIVSKFVSETKLNLRFLKQDHKGPGEARNLGMDHAFGNYLIFIDSDCIADKDWLT
ncbi:MAG: glycosyltransferase family 2 protein, partial [Bacteroidetes bacterium]|nr:glycosyltransferase family 2 protein [Bacteroidota bacterium]